MSALDMASTSEPTVDYASILSDVVSERGTMCNQPWVLTMIWIVHQAFFSDHYMSPKGIRVVLIVWELLTCGKRWLMRAPPRMRLQKPRQRATIKDHSVLKGCKFQDGSDHNYHKKFFRNIIEIMFYEIWIAIKRKYNVSHH